MRLLVLGSCALFLPLAAWAQADLKSDLLSHAAGSKVADRLMAMAEKTHEPSRSSVEIFARDLVAALSRQTLRDAQASQIAAEINAVYKSAGTSTVGYLDHLTAFKAALRTVGVNSLTAITLTDELEAIGKQVRGPDDAPVRPAGFLRPR